MSSLQKDMFKKNRLPPLESLVEDEDEEIKGMVMPPPLSPATLKQRYTPNDWQDYFDRAEDIMCGEGNVFRVYMLDAKVEYATDGKPNPVYVMHHGAGAGALSFGLVAKRIYEESKGAYAVIALDCRGHGHTKTNNDFDFSLSQLSDDLVNVLSKVYQTSDQRQFILVGHSMGGSVVVDIANRQRFPNVMGVVVLDVVEGSALESIQSMNKVLSTRPTSFQSVEQAIQWSYKSKTVRTLEAAKLSIPPLVQLDKDSNKYVWRTNLELTKPYWKEWFTGLSEKFLGSPVAKLLILAGTDRLDKALTIAQMQGKFQLTVVMNSGHFIQEDAPDTTAATLLDFWSRYSRLVLPKHVGQP
ncbi:phosphatase methylesterase 1-like protein [Absidia repens]|uniref:Protein phosphatase methylesterase 1 n=1 Tax=Absidia repens TaxID=90262 RepID=A0A1X2I7B4_9FUNG|nr:phosphatase methylesterase 1-like protein [Absidia repens]